MKPFEKPVMEPLEESQTERARRQLEKHQERRREQLENNVERTLKFFASLTPTQRQSIMRELIRGKKP